MYNNYENYIRHILGYPIIEDFNHNQNYHNKDMFSVNAKTNLEEFYPEIYKIIYPMIQKACDENMGATSREDIEQMTDEIYSALEENDQLNININLGNNISNKNTNQIQNRNNGKSYSNNNLKDLIKILLIRELIMGQNDKISQRPIYNNPMRPPVLPRNYQSLYDIYEY